MPPGQRRLPRCAYAEGRRRCKREGFGDPPLCHLHEVLREDPPPMTLDDVLDDVFARAEDVARRMINKAKRDFSQLAQNQPRQAPINGSPWSPPPRKAPRPPPPPPQPTVPEPDPRDVMGFSPDTKLTREMVKTRQRELAKLFHPDRGGSTAATQRLNVAAKRLLDSL